MKDRHSISLRQQTVCYSNGTLDLMGLFVLLSMIHMLVHVIRFWCQIIQIGITTQQVDQTLQDGCTISKSMMGRVQTSGLQDGQPDVKHVDQMLFYQMVPVETYNATQTGKIIMIHWHQQEHIRQLIETTLRLRAQAEDQVSHIGLPKMKPIHLEDAQEQLIAQIGDTKVKLLTPSK